MNTGQIAYALEQDPKTSKKFCGVFPSDKLPQTIDKYPCGIVVNTDPSTKPGSIGLVSISRLPRKVPGLILMANLQNFTEPSSRTF